MGKRIHSTIYTRPERRIEQNKLDQYKKDGFDPTSEDPHWRKWLLDARYGLKSTERRAGS